MYRYSIGLGTVTAILLVVSAASADHKEGHNIGSTPAGADLEMQVETNTSGIATNAGNITTNAGNITTNSSNITTNTGNITTNTGNITTNAGNITTNSSNISTNTGSIATNAGNITTNAGNITTNSSNITTNAADIAALQNSSGFGFQIFGGSTGSFDISNSEPRFVPMTLPSNGYLAGAFSTNVEADELMPKDGVITSFQCVLDDILTVADPDPVDNSEYECNLIINGDTMNPALSCDLQVQLANTEGANAGCAQGADTGGIPVFVTDLISVMVEPIVGMGDLNPPTTPQMTWYMTVGPTLP